MKKLVSLVLALAMILLVGIAFAEEPTEFAGGAFSTAETTISATNLDSGDAVYYIQLVEWNENSDANADPRTVNAWKLTTAGEACGVSLAELLNGITAAEAATIAANLAETDGTQMTTNGTTATATVETGLYYLRAVATSNDTIYNPAFVSADYYVGGNSVNFLTNIGSSSVVKKSTVTFDKQVGQGDEHVYTYNDVKPGDVIPYKITSQIPAYGAAYDDAVFEITDTFSAGLELEGTISVTYGSTTVTASDANVTITPKADKSGFTVTFAKTYLLSSDRGVTDVTILYSGKVTTAAPLNVNPLDNTADLEYSNAPGETKDKHDITRHYTFSIDGNLLGDSQKITKELLKVGLDQNGNVIEETKETVHEKEISPLAGASFTLTPVDGTGAALGNTTIATISSAADGTLTWNGLDAGTYKLVENSAPDGYIKDARDHYIKIVPHYDTTNKDVLTSYDIYWGLDTENMTKVTTFTMDNPGPLEMISTSSVDTDHAAVENPQGVELPSTGGIGTTIFYILGGLLVVGAAVLLIVRRKAKED